MNDRVKVGCCGFPMARRRYFERFPLVEVQQTFYRPPRPETLKRWRREAPPEFEFTLKAWQLITHPPTSPTYRRLGRSIPPEARDRYGYFRPTEEVRQALETTLDCARRLAARVIVFQCPASFTPTETHIDHLRAFFRQARLREQSFQGAWEPRGDWPRPTVEALCRELDLWPVVDPFAQAPFPDFPRYFRLHGRTGYRYRYTDEDLHRLRTWCTAGTYCLFNNMTMAEDAQRFMALI